MWERPETLERLHLDRRTFGKWALLGAATAGVGFPSAPAQAKERPSGESGPEAEALAAKMLAAVNAEAWKATGAITWKFMRNVHLWDRERNLCRLQTGNKTILVDLSTRAGLAFKRGKRLSGEKEARWVQTAWESWANDSFWLNPVVKIRDEGTRREVVTLEDGSKGLLVTYTSGGVTPGDAYLWLLDEDGKPYEWRFWVSILPFKGMRFSWEKWTELPTGAWISQFHDGLFNVRIKDLAAARNLPALIGDEDPFSPLLEQR